MGLESQTQYPLRGRGARSLTQRTWEEVRKDSDQSSLAEKGPSLSRHTPWSAQDRKPLCLDSLALSAFLVTGECVLRHLNACGPTNAPPLGKGAEMRILIVDDKEQDRYLLEMLLKGTGYEVVAAKNGAEALATLRLQRFDMIITDALMPVMDGFQLCMTVKQDERLRSIPLVFYTGAYTDEKDDELALTMGAHKFIRKPQSPDELLKILTEVTAEVREGKTGLGRESRETKESLLQRYNERVLNKLEQKMQDLEKEITERKRVEEALLAASRYHRVLIETSIDPFVTISPDGRISDVNTATEKVTGYSRDKLIGTDFSDYFTEPDKARAGYQQVFKEGVVKDYELEIRHRGGHVTPVIFSATVYHDESGEIAGVLAAARDITMRRMAEEALRKSEERFRTLVEKAPIAIAFSRNLKFVYVNPEFLKMVGYTNAAELVGQPITDRISPEDLPQFKERARRREDRLTAYTKYEAVGVRKDGTHFPFEAYVTRLNLSDGEVTSAFFHDITERKKAEVALWESEDRYRSFFETSRDCVFMTRLDGQFIDFNDVALEVFGYAPGDRQELLQTNVANFYAKTEEREVHATLVSKQGFSKEYPLDLQKRDGTIVHALVTTVARKDPQGAIIGFQGTIRDITERKRAEEVLQATLQRFYTILSSLCTAVLLVSDKGRVEFVNQAFCDFFNLEEPPSDLHGLGAVEMIQKIQGVFFQPAETIARIQEILAQQRLVTGEEISIRGGRTYLRDFIPILIEGKRYGRLWHHQDITDRKRMEELALQSARLKAVADLSSGVAHHFNNLLQIVMAKYQSIPCRP